MALKSDGTVVAWGRNEFGATSVPVGLTGVLAISAGGYHTVVLANPAVTFADQNVGSASAAKTFTIKNTGGDALAINGVSVTGANAADFTVTTTGMLTSVPAITGTTTLSVTFTPTSNGVRTATLQVTSNDADEGTFNITLTGTGFIPPATDDTGFTTGRKAIDIDVLANDPDLNRATAAIIFPTPPQHGTVRVVGGKVRYLPDGALPLAGDTFTYQYQDGRGGIGIGTVTIANFAALAGDYDGLIDAGLPQIQALDIEPDGAARHRQSGHLRISLSRTGAFTGTLNFGGTLLNQIGQANAGNYSFMGMVDSTGKMVRTIQRRGLPPIVFTLHFDAESSTISGTATSLDDAARFTSELSLANRTAPGPIAGAYPIQIIPDGTVGTPGGPGTANVRIRTTGNVIITGTMPDGTPFSSTAYLHADQTFPLYTILYHGHASARGSLRGLVQFPGAIAARGLFRKGLEWFKPARARDTLFPDGFSVSAFEEFDILIK